MYPKSHSNSKFLFLENLYLLIGEGAKTVTAAEVLGHVHYFNSVMLITEQTSETLFQYKSEEFIIPQ